MKSLISSAPVLAFFYLSKTTTVSADASSFGLGAVLLQADKSGDLTPVAFASRTLTCAELNYAQIEKECLAGVWACEKFQQYLSGLESISLLTDHKPLIPLINRRDLDQVPIRCQRLLMRLRRFNIEAIHVPGKTLLIADTLSQSPVSNPDRGDKELCSVVVDYVAERQENLPVSADILSRVKQATREDETFQKVMRYMQDGWPTYASGIPDEIKPYHQVRGHLSADNGLLLYNSRIAIPASLQNDILTKIHQGHQGVGKCRDRATTCVWWYRMSSDIKNMVETCRFCQSKGPTQRKEPLVATLLPERPWVYIAVDLCDYKNKTYMVVIDYFSRYIELAHLSSTTSHSTIAKLKEIFARWGIPDKVMSDNGPQFGSLEFMSFTKAYAFSHITISPHHSQGNGLAERAVQIAKKILSQDDSNLALMTYRATPVPATGYSPAQLLMGRQMRTTLPVLKEKLKPQWPPMRKLKVNDQKAKSRYTTNYNRRYSVRPLSTLAPGQSVYMKLDQDKHWDTMATVVHGHQDNPRSYIIKTSEGKLFRRNRRHLKPERTTNADSDSDSDSEVRPEPDDDSRTMNTKPVHQTTDRVTTRSGRRVKPVYKMDL